MLLLTIIVYTFIANPSAGFDQAFSWILWTGSLSAIDAAAALGHPLAILAAFVSAPITTLHPLIAAGWVSKIVQAFFHRPSVGDFERLSKDVFTIKGFWANNTRLLADKK